MVWEVKKLGEVCSFENGDRGTNYPSRKNFTETGIPFVNAGHLLNGFIDFNEMNYISIETFELLSRGKFLKGDFLFCLRGSLGKFAFVDNNSNGAIASSLVIVRPSELLTPRYLAHYFGSALCQNMIKKFGAGAAQPNLGAKDLAKFLIPVPTVEEQKRIVAILDEAFEQIDQAKANAEQNLKNAREVFESSLNIFFRPNRQDWNSNKLGQICSISHGYAFKSSDFQECFEADKPIVLTPGNFIETGGINLNKPKTKYFTGKQIPKGYEFELNDLVVVMTDLSSQMKILGKPAIIRFQNILHNQRIGKVHLNSNELHKKFIYFFMLSKTYLNQIKDTATGTMVKHTAPKRILNTVIYYPHSIEEQERICKQLELMWDQIKSLESIYQQKIQALDELKQSLLQKAFSGELTKSADGDAA